VALLIQVQVECVSEANLLSADAHQKSAEDLPSRPTNRNQEKPTPLESQDITHIQQLHRRQQFPSHQTTAQNS
jgi:hypothetical protein